MALGFLCVFARTDNVNGSVVYVEIDEDQIVAELQEAVISRRPWLGTQPYNIQLWKLHKPITADELGNEIVNVHDPSKVAILMQPTHQLLEYGVWENKKIEVIIIPSKEATMLDIQKPEASDAQKPEVPDARKPRAGRIPLRDIGPLQAYMRGKREAGPAWNAKHHDNGIGDITWFRTGPDGKQQTMGGVDTVLPNEISIYNWPRFDRAGERNKKSKNRDTPKFWEAS